MRTDQQLRTDVISVLSEESAFAGLDIKVEVRGAVIVLTGEVHSDLEKWSVEKAATRVWETAGIVSRLQVRGSEAGARVDSDMARSGQPLSVPISAAELPMVGKPCSKPAGGATLGESNE